MKLQEDLIVKIKKDLKGKNNMTEKTIVKALFNYCMDKGIKYVGSNTQCIPGVGEADFLSVSNSKFITEYEIKISRSDFKADEKKIHKHEMMKGTGSRKHFSKERKWVLTDKPFVNYFYYAVPEGLIKIDEVPEYAGLIYVYPVKKWGKYSFKCKVIKKPKRFHREKVTDKIIKAMLRSVMYKYYNKL